ncbi:MAG: LysR substrate-binding domain-containing protein [Ignavibacteriaceae bacterium]|jgi:LysR family hydrogen peroxide-inducible transcriptional activator
MTLAQLYYIVALDSFRHFGTAANHCFVTQPTLSMQIQKLEEELGIFIFDRSKQPVVPTDIGAKVIKQAKIILQESERLQNIIDSETGTYNGTLKIGIIPTIAPYLIPLFLRPFVEKYPGIEIIIDEITTKEILRALHKDLIDVGILALPVNIPDFIEQTLYYEPFVAYIHKKHPLFNLEKIDVDSLSRDDLLLLKEGHCLRGQALKLCRTSEKEWRENERKVLFESGTIDTLKKLVEQNFGITLLPYLAVKDIQSKEQLSLVREFNPPVPKREIGLIYSKTLLKKHFVEALTQEIQKVIPKILLEKENSLIVK